MSREEGLVKAREIVRQAMSDPALYDQMTEKEAAVWGRILPARERNEAAAEDRSAAEELGIRPVTILRLEQLVAERGRPFEFGLVLGCGEGRAERELLEQKVCRKFHGIDISEPAIEEARRIAAEHDLPISYEIADLNRAVLPEAKFDLVVAQTCLHHILFLEHLADQIWRSLLPGGQLWIHDYIGEMQFQYDEERLALVNRLLAVLPEKLRLNRIQNRVVSEMKRPRPGYLASPFESIRSEDIVAVFGRWFNIEWSEVFGAVNHLVVPPGTRSAYLENEDTRALHSVLSLLDEICLRTGFLRPAGGKYLMSRRDARSAEPIASAS